MLKPEQLLLVRHAESSADVEGLEVVHCRARVEMRDAEVG